MSCINLVNNTTENNITLSSDRVSIEANVKTRITSNTKVNLEVSPARGPAGQDGSDGLDGQDGLDGTSYAANNGIAIISDVIQLGSDSLSDDKGSELTHDTYIHLNGFSEIFKGSLFGNDSILEIGSDGVLTFDRTSAETGTPTTYMMKYKALTDSHYFNFCQSSTDGGAGVYNNVFIMGWNLTPGGGAEEAGKSGIGFSFEDNYEPILGSKLAEIHTFFIDENGTQNRLESYTIIKDNPSLWEKYNTLGKLYIKDPMTNNTWLSYQGGGAVSKIVMTDSAYVNTKGTELINDSDQNLFTIKAEGLAVGITEIWRNQLQVTDFGQVTFPQIAMIRYNNLVIFRFRDYLPVYETNAAAISGGLSWHTVYTNSAGDLKVVI